ncbi:nudix hydrolase 15, mitochondrial [Beta vulgaris subsp. vulgaris]|uniref:nudix hydrolase 15, mitochondrial n=1 Tax=Beta vulgaris subsp. vulgaris TaxID=3555 RepID=UPI0020372237|nr:nudix hydrolase 15, mitochondrial [Beta vulgaris subsp. vulgaris]
MDAKGEADGLKPLSDLAQQLRLRQAVNVGSRDNQPRSRSERRAAVLVCIFQGNDGELRVILTQRASTLSSHSGEVALPGGKMEEGDKDEVATALREAKEEIGLDPSLVDVVSVLQPFTMKNGMVVVPVLGLLFDKTAFQPTPNTAEVEAIFDVPLDMFLKDENRREAEREWMGEKYLLHYFDYEVDGTKFVIFALTAGFLIETASLVYQRSPAFVEMKPNFWNKLGNTSNNL